MPVAEVWPELPSVQVCVACDGVTTFVFVEQALRVSCAAVFTCRPNDAEAAVPDAGVALRVPL